MCKYLIYESRAWSFSQSLWEVKFCSEEDVFLSCYSTEKKHLSLFLYQAQNLPSFLFYLQNMTLATLLILAVLSTYTIFEPHHGPCSP